MPSFGIKRATYLQLTGILKSWRDDGPHRVNAYPTGWTARRTGPLGHPNSSQIIRAVPKGSDPNKTDDETEGRDVFVIYGTAVVLTAIGILSFTFFREPLEDVLYGGGFDFTLGSVTVGDVATALFWGVSLYFVSPLQLLLLFLGKIDTERPSDWLFNRFGKLVREELDDPQYILPPTLRAMGILWFAICGILTSYVFHVALGGATWGVSTGIGACVGAGVYEVGRPQRLSQEEAEELEQQWRDFVDFASRRLQYNGQCHESEIFGAFKTDKVKYRNQNQITEKMIRYMIKKWAPKAERTTYGFYKNISVRAQIDPFTGEWKGRKTQNPVSDLKGNEDISGQQADS